VTGFLVKKTLIDAADNLAAVLLLNAGFMGVIAALYGLNLAVFALSRIVFPAATDLSSFAGILVLSVASCALVSVYIGAVSGVARQMTDGTGVTAGDFLAALKRSCGSSLVFGAVQGLALGLLFNAGTFYLPLAADNILFFMIFFAVFWLYLYWLAAAQFFFPLQSRFDKHPVKNMRKMFLLLSDNFVFTVFFLAPLALLAFGLSFALILLFPGIASILLLQNNALKLRLFKYDYLDAHPGADRRRIPWPELLAAERERVGTRSLRSVIFPWKK
jgi:hypothetical protein